jgi:predicted nucleic acid-binding protein
MHTSNFIVAECHGLLLNRVGRTIALAFLDGLSASGLNVIHVTSEDEARAVEIIRQYDDKNFSYVDASSFALMERFGIDTAFSFDRHFAQYGFRVLEAP